MGNASLLTNFVATSDFRPHKNHFCVNFFSEKKSAFPLKVVDVVVVVVVVVGLFPRSSL